MGEMADEMYDMMLTQEDDYEDYLYDLLERGIWPSKNGDINISEMSDDHLKNSIKYLDRNPKILLANIGYKQILEEELKRRSL
jgi:hypothetical protein